jgi:hypothetical protein
MRKLLVFGVILSGCAHYPKLLVLDIPKKSQTHTVDHKVKPEATPEPSLAPVADNNLYDDRSDPGDQRQDLSTLLDAAFK